MDLYCMHQSIPLNSLLFLCTTHAHIVRNLYFMVRSSETAIWVHVRSFNSLHWTSVTWDMPHCALEKVGLWEIIVYTGELKEKDPSLRKTIVPNWWIWMNILAPPTSRGGSIQHGASKAICYALASSSSHVIKLLICYWYSLLKFLSRPLSYACNDIGPAHA